jgi:hypothetical protein
MAEERRFEGRAGCAARGETRREEARRAEGAAEPAVATEDAMANMAATACVERRAMKWMGRREAGAFASDCSFSRADRATSTAFVAEDVR